MRYASERDAFLLVLAVEAENEPRWAGYAAYLRDRERGLRKSALAKMTEFLDETKRWAEVERRAFVRWLCAKLECRPDVLDHAMPHPLATSLIQPTLSEWSEIDSRDPLPHRWLGILFGYSYWEIRSSDGEIVPLDSYSHLRRAIELDPKEQPARVRLIEILIASIDYAIHHLPDFFIGAPAEALQAAEEASSLACDVDETEERDRLMREIEAVRQPVEDWILFQEKGGGDFDAWCRARNRNYRWVRAYYYYSPK